MATEAPQPMDTAPRDGSVISAQVEGGGTIDVWFDDLAGVWLTDTPYDNHTMIAPNDEAQQVEEAVLTAWRPAA